MEKNFYLEQQIDLCLQDIPQGVSKLVVGFSGGLDSSVLLHLLQSKDSCFQVLAWHVNHGLQSVANDMTEFCGEFANRFGIDLKISRLDLKGVNKNIEAVARSARYALFADELSERECLFTAHHADDQAETFLLNVLRGAGSAGLRSIASNRRIGRTRLYRPLLRVDRNDILLYAKFHNIPWYEDPSNNSDRFNRNFLRQKIMPVLKQRWPGCLESFNSTIAIQAETKELLDNLAESDYLDLCSDKDESRNTLSLPLLARLSTNRQKNVLRYWLQIKQCVVLPQKKLVDLVKQLNARVDAVPVIEHADYILRIYNRKLYLTSPTEQKELNARYDFGRQTELVIDAIALRITRAELFDRLDIEDNGQAVSLRFRIDSAALNPHRHRLKRLFQRNKIPTWLRSRTVQVYLDDNLIDLWV